MTSYLLLRLDSAQRVGRGEDRDALIRAEIEQVEIACDDEIGAGGQCAGEHVIIVGIATGGCRQRLRLHDVRRRR